MSLDNSDISSKKDFFQKEKVELLIEKNKQLERFAYHTAHNLKGPLNNVSQILHLYLKSHIDEEDTKGKMLIELAKKSINKLRSDIQKTLEYSTIENSISENKINFDIDGLKSILINNCIRSTPFQLEIRSTVPSVYLNIEGLIKILDELVDNAIRFCFKDEIRISIDIVENDELYSFTVSDNACGMSPSFVEKAFDLYAVNEVKDRFGDKCSGIGLATVHKVVYFLHGDISLNSIVEEGSQFILQLPR